MTQPDRPRCQTKQHGRGAPTEETLPETEGETGREDQNLTGETGREDQNLSGKKPAESGYIFENITQTHRKMYGWNSLLTHTHTHTHSLSLTLHTNTHTHTHGNTDMDTQGHG